MTTVPSFKESIKPLENLIFVDSCVTTLNDFKLDKLINGLRESISNISIILNKDESEMEELVTIGARHFTGTWWAKIAEGQLNFIEDNNTNRKEAIKIYEKIATYKIKDIVNFVLQEWIIINKKNKIFPFKLSSPKDFFKNKDADKLALILWWVHYYTTLVGCHEEPNGIRKILCLKKSFLGKWSKEQWIKTN